MQTFEHNCILKECANLYQQECIKLGVGG